MENLYNGDCVEIMSSFEEKSIDLVIADPPYNINKDFWDSWKTKDLYIEWMGVWIKQIERILKNNGSFYIFHNDFEQIAMLINWIRTNTTFKFRQLITWNKYFPGMENISFAERRLSVNQSRNYYGGFTEYILFYTFQDETGLSQILHDTNRFQNLRKYFEELQKAIDLTIKKINISLNHRKAEHSFYWDSTQWSLPTKEVYKEIIRLPRKQSFEVREYEELRREYEELRREYEKERYTFNVQRTDDIFSYNPNNNVWEYNWDSSSFHETPKPIPLLENIILHSSNEKDVVLDPFMGTGSTCVSCLNLNRKFIGIEKHLDYFIKAKERILNHTTQLKLF